MSGGSEIVAELLLSTIIVRGFLFAHALGQAILGGIELGLECVKKRKRMSIVYFKKNDLLVFTLGHVTTHIYDNTNYYQLKILMHYQH